MYCKENLTKLKKMDSLAPQVMKAFWAFDKAAVADGAKLVHPVEDKFYGDRTGTIEDPFGHTWHVGTHKEDVPEDEMKRRMASMAKAG